MVLSNFLILELEGYRAQVGKGWHPSISPPDPSSTVSGGAAGQAWKPAPPAHSAPHPCKRPGLDAQGPREVSTVYTDWSCKPAYR